MTNQEVETEFREKVSSKVRLAAEGADRFRVFTPFRFEDGDHLAVVLKKRENQWVLSDEGHTFMHLSYWVDEKDLGQGNRHRIIEKAVASFGLEDNNGELVLPINNGSHGDALFSFVQAIIHIADVTYLNRELVRSTFMDDLQSLIKEAVPQDKREFGWRDPVDDPEGRYPVDCRISANGSPPLFVFGITNDDKCSLATIVILHYRTMNKSFQSLAVFQNQEAIGRKQVARLTDVADKQFSSLDDNRSRLVGYLAERMKAPHSNGEH